MGIDIYIANSIEEPYKKSDLPHVRIEDNIQEFIWKYRELFKENIQIYLELEPYDNMILSNKQIVDLKMFAENLLNPEKISLLESEFDSKYNIDKKEYLVFAKELYNLCQDALQSNQDLVSLGD